MKCGVNNSIIDYPCILKILLWLWNPQWNYFSCFSATCLADKGSPKLLMQQDSDHQHTWKSDRVVENKLSRCCDVPQSRLEHDWNAVAELKTAEWKPIQTWMKWRNIVRKSGSNFHNNVRHWCQAEVFQTLYFCVDFCSIITFM